MVSTPPESTTSSVRDHRSSSLHIPTIVAISIIAWALSNTGHEIVGHGGVCALQGHSTVYVSTSFQFCSDVETSSPGQERAVIAGGTLFNLLLALGCWLALTRAKPRDGRIRYFFWVLLSVNLFYSASYIMGWFIGPTLDWSLFLVGLEPQVAWKLGLICVGLLILWLGFRLSRRLFEPFLGQEPTERRKRMTVLTLTPYLMAIVIKMSAAAISPNPDKTLVLLGAFGATGFFLIWINLLRFWPLGKGRETARPAVQLARSVPWIAIAAVTLALYIGVLGRGIGELPH